MPDDTIVVIGGGIVGLACAYELASAGRTVHVIDRGRIGTGSSGGNAGWVTQSQCFPVPAPGAVRTALKSAGRPDAPLYVRPSLSPSLMRWLWEFRKSCRPAAFAQGTKALSALAVEAEAAFGKWATDGIDTTLSNPGLLHAFLDEREAERTLALQRSFADGRFDVPDIPLSTDDALRLEPALSPRVRAAYLIAGEGLVEPRLLLASLVDRLRALNVSISERRTVTGFGVERGRVRSVLLDGDTLDCSEVVIAGGSWSAELLAGLGCRVRMQAGKGYSFSVNLPVAPRHPLYLGDKHVAVSPIGSTTRVAGTMEFSGNNLRLDWRRIEAIARASRHYLGDWFGHSDELIGLIADPWVGGRPMLPDGLPLIDRVPTLDNAYVATGHGMLGVTLAPSSAAALTDLMITGSRPDHLVPFGFGRL
jgi:glycine/D-amino acid oxidase-like deaminating enzyme